MPLVSSDEWRIWATEQAHLIGNAFQDAKQIGGCAAVIRACGGSTENLPIAFSKSGWVDAQFISELATEYDEILIVQDVQLELARQYGFANIELLENVLTIESGVPGISNITSTCYDEQWLTMERHYSPFHSQSLEGVVIEAAAKTWNCGLTEVINASGMDKKNGKLTIGYSSGQPLIVRADVIRNPLCFNGSQADT